MLQPLEDGYRVNVIVTPARSLDRRNSARREFIRTAPTPRPYAPGLLDNRITFEGQGLTIL